MTKIRDLFDESKIEKFIEETLTRAGEKNGVVNIQQFVDVAHTHARFVRGSHDYEVMLELPDLQGNIHLFGLGAGVERMKFLHYNLFVRPRPDGWVGWDD